MLQTIRDRAQGIFAWVMLILVGIPFALWGIQNYIDTGTEKPAAKVGGQEILDRDVTRAYEQSLNSLVGIEDPDEKKLRQEALDRLISQEVIVQSAQKRSLVVSDEEARELIQTLPYFQTEGKFDKDKYRVMLAAQGMSPDQFAGQIRRALVTEQFQEGVMKTAFVTKAEQETLMRLQNQERDLEYVKLPLPTVTKSFSDEAISNYYKANAADYRNPEKVSVDYLLLDLDALARDVTVSEDDLHKIYEEQKATLGTPERRKVSHILILNEGKDEKSDQAARAKADEIRDRIAKGEDFAKLAQEFSGDSVSAKKGGDLGYLEKDVQEEAFTQAAQALKPGETSAPVKSSFGYHLIKLTELVPEKVKPFEAVRDELRKTAQRNKAETAFYSKGQKLAELTFEHPDSLDAAARELGLKIEHTGLFTRDQGEGLANEEAIRKAAFVDDTLGGRNSEPVELGNDKAVVLRVKEHQASSEKPLAEVRDAIITRLRGQEARTEVANQAESLIKAIREGKSLTDAAKSFNLQITKTGFVNRQNSKQAPELINAAFSAGRPETGKPAVGEIPVPADGSRFVFVVTAVKDGASTGQDETRKQDEAKQLLTRIASQQEFTAFVERLRELTDVEVTRKD